MVIQAMEETDSDNAADSGTGEGHGDRMAEYRERLQRAATSSTIGKAGHAGFVPASAGQIDFLRRLLHSRSLSNSMRELITTQINEGTLSKQQAGNYIRELRRRKMEPCRGSW